MKLLKCTLIIVAFLGLEARAQDSLNVRRLGQAHRIEWGSCNGVTIHDGYACVSTGGLANSAIRFVDISDPENPGVRGSYWSSDGIGGAIVIDQYVYVATAGLRIADWTNPYYPMETGVVDLPDGDNGIAMTGQHVYIAFEASGPSHGGVYVVNVADPASPQLLATFHHGDDQQINTIWGVAVSGNHAYAIDLWGHLYVIDIADPAHPTEVGSIDLPWGGFGVATSGSYVGVACDSSLYVVDASDPTQPTLVGVFHTSAYLHGIAASGSFMFLANTTNGLRVVSIADPANPYEVGFYDTPGGADGVAVDGNIVCVADGTNLGIYDVSQALAIQHERSVPQPSSPALYPGYPNPFNASTTITYDLPNASRVSLRVSDLLGREMTVLKDGFAEAGSHRVMFDGSRLTSGIYFVRLDAGKFSQTKKLMLLK